MIKILRKEFLGSKIVISVHSNVLEAGTLTNLLLIQKLFWELSSKINKVYYYADHINKLKKEKCMIIAIDVNEKNND